MDIGKTLRELYAERKRLDAAIARLEARRVVARPSKSPKRRRGRKSMSPEERREVSKRMTRYWEARRAQERALENAGNKAAPKSAAD